MLQKKITYRKFSIILNYVPEDSGLQKPITEPL